MSCLKKKASIEDNILKFEIFESTAKSVTNFYSEKPFPNYKADDNKISILNSGDRNYLAKYGFNDLVLLGYIYFIIT